MVLIDEVPVALVYIRRCVLLSLGEHVTDSCHAHVMFVGLSTFVHCSSSHASLFCRIRYSGISYLLLQLT